MSRNQTISGWRNLRKIFVLVLLFSAACFVLTVDASELSLPDSAADKLQKGKIKVGNLERTYRFYIPVELVRNPSLVLVFHGAGGDALRIRMISGYQWEKLADKNNFIVVYPEGFEKHWNGCRKNAYYSAKRKNIDDVDFVRALVSKFKSQYDIAPDQVFAAGLSNGGHMVYRLALESPELFHAVAAIGANLPLKEDNICDSSRGAVSVMILNGTEDSINPFQGGDVRLPDGTTVGKVLSSQETADFFRQIAGYKSTPMTYRYPEIDGLTETSVERITWDAASLPEVSLYKVNGGGHNIPQSVFRVPDAYGRTVTEINGPEEIWKFFERQLARNRLKS